MAKKNESILDLLSLFPWWVSVCVTFVVYVGLKFIVPTIAFENPILKGMAPMAPQLAWVAAIFLLPAADSALKSFGKRRLLDQQSGIESIRSLPWKRFEELLGEAYRRQGFVVKENLLLGPDGGVDLTIEKAGNRYLVQCKQWRVQKVGVKVAREMFGLMTAQRASGVIIVTSGMFTQEARTFAADKPIDLVAGNQLVELVRAVQTRPAVEKEASIEIAPEYIHQSTGTGNSVTVADQKTTVTEEQCPDCGGNLVLRDAKRGSRVGNKFWGVFQLSQVQTYRRIPMLTIQSSGCLNAPKAGTFNHR